MTLDDKDKVLLGAAAIIAAAIYFAPAREARFAMISGGDGLAAYRLDRQTGAVSACFATQCRPVEFVKP